jgi:hypothetical protein
VDIAPATAWPSVEMLDPYLCNIVVLRDDARFARGSARRDGSRCGAV